MVKHLGPIIVLMLTGQTALAQQPSTAVRIDLPPLSIPRNFVWNTDPVLTISQPPAPTPVKPDTPAGPLDLLILVSSAF